MPYNRLQLLTSMLRTSSTGTRLSLPLSTTVQRSGSSLGHRLTAALQSQQQLGAMAGACWAIKGRICLSQVDCGLQVHERWCWPTTGGRFRQGMGWLRPSGLRFTVTRAMTFIAIW